MPHPTLVLASLLTCAVAAPPELTDFLDASPPPWRAALLARVHAMEGEITVMKAIISMMKATISTQQDRLNEQSQTIQGHSRRITELEPVVSMWQPGGGAEFQTATSPDHRLRGEARIQRSSTSEVLEEAQAQAKQLASHTGKIAALEEHLLLTKDANASHHAIEVRLRSVEAKCAEATASSRRLEEDDGHDYVTQHFAAVTLASGPVGTGTMDGGAGNIGSGHRRTQGAGSSGSCANINIRALAVQTECCDEPTEDCSTGVPSSCNADCAAVFLPFWGDCGALLTANGANYQSVVAQCQAAGTSSGGAGSGNLVHQFGLTCTNTTVTNCVPVCSAALHGDLLLMAVNGQDNKYACELHNSIYSWIGPASDGGYIGSDVLSFVSAVVSGAAGLFMLTLMSSASISTTLTIQPGQTVAITGIMGQHIGWGIGGFSVLQRASLTLEQVTLNGHITVAEGAILQLNDVTFLQLACMTAATGSSVGLNRAQTPPTCPQCNPIQNCRHSECTAMGSICTECDAGYYSFHSDVTAGGCWLGTTGMGSVLGLTSVAGAYYFGFAGTIPEDLRYIPLHVDNTHCTSWDQSGLDYPIPCLESTTGRGWVTTVVNHWTSLSKNTVGVPARASLILAGTGAEVIVASFNVDGSLSITSANLSGNFNVHGSLSITSANFNGSVVVAIAGSLVVTRVLIFPPQNSLRRMGRNGVDCSYAELSRWGYQSASAINPLCRSVGHALDGRSGLLVYTPAISVAAGGVAIVRQATFHSRAGDVYLYSAVQLEAGGNLTVVDSHLVRANGRADPLPCDGTSSHCVGPHAGPVTVSGPGMIAVAPNITNTTWSWPLIGSTRWDAFGLPYTWRPLVCDAGSGQCTIVDTCAEPTRCSSNNPNSHIECVSPLGYCRCGGNRHCGTDCTATLQRTIINSAGRQTWSCSGDTGR
eukprot:COSAG01_NODE_2468_length_7634_cov_6.744127_1_plen_930_part_00